ncbi:hypothetical protein SRRS_44970 [Sporomusa rhizae]
MTLHSKKLHIRKTGVVTDINLYTTIGEAGNSALAVKDGRTTVYAKLGLPTDSLASPLRVRKSGNTYAVLTATAEPVSTPLFAYTLSNEYLNHGVVGAIYGDRYASPTTFTVQANKIIYLNGEAAVFGFLQGTNSRLVLSQYTGSSINLRPNKIIDPFAANWSPPLTEQTWNDVANLHAITAKDPWLCATSYDLSRIAVVNMNNNYQEVRSYQFPTAWPAISLPATARSHGERLTIVGNYLYALFTVNTEGQTTPYSNSFVVKLLFDRAAGMLMYMKHLEVGKNALTLEHFNNKLYICCIGGSQKEGNSNPETCLDIIDLATFTKTTVLKSAGMNGNISSITIADKEHAYIFMGNYDADYTNMIGGVYHTTIANIIEPVFWSKVLDVNNSGRFWGVYNDSNHLWFARGKSIEIFPSLPVGPASSVKSFNLTNLGMSEGDIKSVSRIL